MSQSVVTNIDWQAILNSKGMLAYVTWPNKDRIGILWRTLDDMIHHFENRESYRVNGSHPFFYIAEITENGEVQRKFVEVWHKVLLELDEDQKPFGWVHV